VVKGKRKKQFFQLNQKQKKLYASRLTELSNLVVVALFFSQFLAERISLKATAVGIITWLITYSLGHYLLKK